MIDQLAYIALEPVEVLSEPYLARRFSYVPEPYITVRFVVTGEILACRADHVTPVGDVARALMEAA